MRQQRADSEYGEVVWSPRLGAHLEAARQRAGMRRVDLAQRLGVSEETIRLWERGVVQPTPGRLARLIPVLAIEASLWQQEPAATANPDDDLPELARRLRAERAARGLTQVTVAGRLGVAQATYAGWETGRAAPGPQHLPAVAAELGMDVARLQVLIEEPFVVDTSGWSELGKVIGARREALRLTRENLASGLATTTRTVMAWELGYRMPPADQVHRLAAVLGTSPEVLLQAMPLRRGASQLGDLILRRQRALGLRSTDLARRLGATEATVSRWINGHSRPREANMRRLAEVLEVAYPRLRDAAGGAA